MSPGCSVTSTASSTLTNSFGQRACSMTQLLEAFTSLKNPTLAGTKSTQRYGPQKCCLPVVPTVHKRAQCGPPHNAPHFLKLFALSCKHHARSRARRSLPSLPQLQLRGHPCFLHPSRPHHSCRNCGGHGHGAHQCKRKEPPNHCILTLILTTPSDYALCDQRTTLPVLY